MRTEILDVADSARAFKLTIGITPVEVYDPADTKILSGRKIVTVYNNHSTNVIYLGFNSAVSSSTGLPILPGQERQVSVGFPIKVWIVASGSGTDARCSEGAHV